MNSRSILVSLLLASSALQPLVSAQELDDGMVGGDVITSTICGPEDDRVRSYDLRQGRLVMPDGTCTAWLISEEVFLTAGHCGILHEDWRVHFTFDVDDAPEEDQYAVDPPSYASGINSSQGKDWGAGRLLPNSITENLPGVAQTLKCGTYACGWYSLGSVPSQVSGTRITITGYGVSSDPDDTTPQPQKTSTGPLSSITSSQLFYATDSMVSWSFLFRARHSLRISGWSLHHTMLQNSLTIITNNMLFLWFDDISHRVETLEGPS